MTKSSYKKAIMVGLLFSQLLLSGFTSDTVMGDSPFGQPPIGYDPFEQPQDHQGYAITNITHVDFEKLKITNSSVEKFGNFGSYLLNRGKVALIFNLTTNLIFYGNYNITLFYPTSFYVFYAEYTTNIKEYANITRLPNFYEHVISPFTFPDPAVYIYNANITFMESLLIILEEEPTIDLGTNIYFDLGIDCVMRDIICLRTTVLLDNNFQMQNVYYQNHMPQITTTLVRTITTNDYLLSPILAIVIIGVTIAIVSSIVFIKRR